MQYMVDNLATIGVEKMGKPTLDQFIITNRHHMKQVLKALTEELKEELNSNPGDYIEYGCDVASIPVRLCVDIEENDNSSWIFRTGDSSFDQRHSIYCASSFITQDTNHADLLDELIIEL